MHTFFLAPSRLALLGKTDHTLSAEASNQGDSQVLSTAGTALTTRDLQLTIWLH